MNEKELEQVFSNLNGSFDIEEPNAGHRERFIAKLNPGEVTLAERAPRSGWRQAFAVAASLAVVCVLAVFLSGPEQTLESQVAKISPEASSTELYFTSLIEEQVKQLQALNTPETTTLVADTMAQLHILEADYSKLEQDLVNGGNSNLILKAMIANFQTRIDLIQGVLNTIESINNINTTNDENFTI